MKGLGELGKLRFGDFAIFAPFGLDDNPLACFDQTPQDPDIGPYPRYDASTGFLEVFCQVQRHLREDESILVVAVVVKDPHKIEVELLHLAMETLLVGQIEKFLGLVDSTFVGFVAAVE